MKILFNRESKSFTKRALATLFCFIMLLSTIASVMAVDYIGDLRLNNGKTDFNFVTKSADAVKGECSLAYRSNIFSSLVNTGETLGYNCQQGQYMAVYFDSDVVRASDGAYWGKSAGDLMFSDAWYISTSTDKPNTKNYWVLDKEYQYHYECYKCNYFIAPPVSEKSCLSKDKTKCVAMTDVTCGGTDYGQEKYCLQKVEIPCYYCSDRTLMRVNTKYVPACQDVYFTEQERQWLGVSTDKSLVVGWCKPQMIDCYYCDKTYTVNKMSLADCNNVPSYVISIGGVNTNRAIIENQCVKPIDSTTPPSTPEEIVQCAEPKMCPDGVQVEVECADGKYSNIQYSCANPTGANLGIECDSDLYCPDGIIKLKTCVNGYFVEDTGNQCADLINTPECNSPSYCPDGSIKNDCVDGKYTPNVGFCRAVLPCSSDEKCDNGKVLKQCQPSGDYKTINTSCTGNSNWWDNFINWLKSLFAW